jgi:type II secretory pathway pseudopilin PulG
LELLIVIAIIGLLTSIIFGVTGTARSRTRDAQRLGDIRQIQLALEMFYSSQGYYPSCHDVGYAGGCDMNDFLRPGSRADTSQDGVFMQFLAPYLSKPVQDPLNDFSNLYVYIYGTNGEYPVGSGNYYKYVLVVKLENPNNPALKSSITYGDPAVPQGFYVIGQEK